MPYYMENVRKKCDSARSVFYLTEISYQIKKPPKGGGTFRRRGTEDRSDPILWQQKIDNKRN